MSAVVEDKLLIRFAGTSWYGGKIYRQIVEAGEATEAKVIITEHLFEELGRPTEITLTLEPGDKLNESN